MPEMKRGLVVEGGGMRGAHTCGILWPLVQTGRTHFDVVTATSAGTCTSAYFVAKQFNQFSWVSREFLHDRQFINLRKLFSRHSVMDLDYLINYIFRDVCPLDIKALQETATEFYITATRCDTAQPVYFNNHHDDIFTALKASAAMPVAYKHPVVIGDQQYIDGGISDSIPIQKAIDEGCDEIVVLMTRPLGYRMKPPFANLLPALFNKKFPAVAQALKQRHNHYNDVLRRIEKQDYPCKLTVIRPKDKLPVSRLTTKHEKIMAAIQMGYRDALAALQDHPN